MLNLLTGPLLEILMGGGLVVAVFLAGARFQNARRRIADLEAEKKAAEEKAAATEEIRGEDDAVLVDILTGKRR